MTATAIPASSRVKGPVSDNLIRWLILGGVLLIAAIAIGTTIMVGNFRQRALDNSKRELENTVLLLSRHFDQQLDDFGAVQEDLIAYVQSHGVDSADQYKRRMSSLDIHLMLKAKLSALSYVGGINIFDADGVLINSSSLWPVPAISVADRPYFQAFKAGPQSPTMLVEPVYSRITGVWTTVIARKIIGPNGEFLGAIGRGIEPTNFQKFFASLALGDDAAIAMFHRDGTLLARYPQTDSLLGQNFAEGAFFQKILSKADQGTLRFSSPVDGQDRLGAVRQLNDYAIVVIATTPVAAALADWSAQIRFLIVAAGLFMLVITALLFLVVRKLSQQHRVSRQRLTLENNGSTPPSTT
jgi:hypothetical protein